MTSKRALVLSGGGARGAYAAGVIRYIVDDIAKDLGRPVHFDIISGTSVGAINAAWLAATMHDPEFCGQRLWYLWRTMQLKEAVKVSNRNVATMLYRLFRDTPDSVMEPKRGRSVSLLDTEYIANIIRDEVPWANIQKNIHDGILDALTVTATDVHTGRTTVFVQSERMELPPWTRDPRRKAVAGPIDANKVMASAAIPLFFPAIKIDDHWFFDGGLRQNTPIAPALRMGADKVLVISLKSAMRFTEPSPEQLEKAPTGSFLIGKVLNALLLDPLDYDLSYLERINGLLRHGEEAFGKDVSFIDTLNDVVEAYRGQGYRIVDTTLFRPSQDLGQLATDFAGALSNDEWGSPILATIGRRASDMEGYRESDFLSFLLFDAGYTGRLLDLGYADAANKHDELVRFFTD